jgi:hypothetical protein
MRNPRSRVKRDLREPRNVMQSRTGIASRALEAQSVEASKLNFAVKRSLSPPPRVGRIAIRIQWTVVAAGETRGCR